MSTNAAAACIVRAERRFLGFAPKKSPALWTLELDASADGQIDDGMILAAGRSSFLIKVCASKIGGPFAHAIANKLAHLINIVHLDLGCTWWSWHAE